MTTPSITPLGCDGTSSSVIIRGITLYDIMKYWPWGASVSLKHKVWDRLSCKVEDVTDYDIFISHAWESNSLLKAVALAVRHNSMKAVLISLLVCWLLCNIDVPGYVRLSVPCLCAIICVRWGFVLTLGNSPRVFFDRCCIPQDAPHKKLECIRSIPHYLQHSKSFVLMWDKPFTTRLWCMFEFALFTETHGSHKLEVLPLMTVKFAVVFFLTSFSSWLCSELFSNTIPVVIIDIIFVASTGWYAIWYFYPQAEESVNIGFKLKVEELECSLKTDKDILLSYVRSVHGSYRNFDRMADRICRDVVRNWDQQPFLIALTCLSILPSTLAAYITGGFITSIVIATFPNLVCCVYSRLLGSRLVYAKGGHEFIVSSLVSVCACIISLVIISLARYVYGLGLNLCSSSCCCCCCGSCSSIDMYAYATVAQVLCCVILAALLTRSTFLK